MSEVGTPRLTEDAIQQIRLKLKRAAPQGTADLGSREARELIEDDVPALCNEVERLRCELDAHKEHLRFALQRAHAEKF